MDWLPQSLQTYFQGLSGFDDLLPPIRVQNKPLLKLVYEALLQEGSLSRVDLNHINSLIHLADRVVIPDLCSGKNLAEAEIFCVRKCPSLSKPAIRYCLRYIAFLLTRHVTLDPQKLKQDLIIWRLVQRFPSVQQGLVADYIDWCHEKAFSPVTIYNGLRELLKFYRWTQIQGIASFLNVNHKTLMAYLEERHKGDKVTSKQRSLAHLKPLFFYAKDRIDGTIKVPDLVVHAPKNQGLPNAANSEEVERLWQALEKQEITGSYALMLGLIIGYACPVKMLPLLRLSETPYVLTYEYRQASRLGVSTRVLDLSNAPDWLKQCLPNRNEGFLFQTSHGIKRHSPISTMHCKRIIAKTTRHVLGYSIPINRLERGMLQVIAGRSSLLTFLKQSKGFNLNNNSLLLIWLQRQNTEVLAFKGAFGDNRK